MLYEYILKNYKVDEPIFFADIELPVSNTYLRQMFKNLCDDGKIKRFDKGVYYLPSNSRLKGGTRISLDKVVRYKYVERGGKVNGYYSGFTFANQMGITTQVPFTLEVVSNAASASVRQIEVQGQRIVLRRPRATITEQNFRILQFLDLLKDIEIYADELNRNVALHLVKYIRAEKIRQEEMDQYLPLYPDKVYRNLYEMRLYNAFA